MANKPVTMNNHTVIQNHITECLDEEETKIRNFRGQGNQVKSAKSLESQKNHVKNYVRMVCIITGEG